MANRDTIKAMNNLPDTPVVLPVAGTSNTSAAPSLPSAPPAAGAGGNTGKETEPVITAPFPESAGIIETHKDLELPREVVKSGVIIAPQQVTIPAPVQQAGVQPAGSNVTLGNGQTVTLPLTDEAMNRALKAGVAESVRWLAEWCVRELKKVQASVLPKSKH